MVVDVERLMSDLGKPFLTGHSGCEGGPYVQLRYETLAQAQIAHDALFKCLNDHPAREAATDIHDELRQITETLIVFAEAADHLEKSAELNESSVEFWSSYIPYEQLVAAKTALGNIKKLVP